MDFGNLLTPTAASSKKSPSKPFRPHSLNVTRSRSIPASEARVNMRPRPSDRLNLNEHITKGRYSKWDGESSMPVVNNNSWWKGEAAGLQGTIQEQRRARLNRENNGGMDDDPNHHGKSAKIAKKERQLQAELALTRDRFGREYKDALKSGKLNEEKKPSLADATARKTLDKYDSQRLNSYAQIGIRCQYVQDCNDVIHRDWKNRYANPPQARDADAVTALLEEKGLLENNQQHHFGASSVSSSSTSRGGSHQQLQQTYRVLPPLPEVEKVYFMNRGQASKSGKRFASPFAKNERSAREGYINNDNALGRTTPVGDRETASNAPKLACLALATSDARRTIEDDEANNQASHRATFSMSRNVSVLPEQNTSEELLMRKQQKYRPDDSSRVRLNGLQRPERVVATSALNQFNAIPSSVLRIMQPAGL